MKKYFILFTLVLSFTFIIFIMPQESNYGIGKSNVFIQPAPAQGSSVGIEYNFNRKNYIKDVTKEYTISFDSESNNVEVKETEFIQQEFLPLYTGTEFIEVEDINNNYQGLNLADFYYSMILESRTYNWAWYLNYDWTNFQERLNTLGNQGFRIENFDTYGKNVFNYAGTWTADGAGWAWVLNYTNLNDFINVLNSWQNSSPRYRPIDFTMNPSGSQLYYGAVAKADNLGFSWIFNENLSSNFINWINTQYSSGRRLVEIQFYRNPSGTFMCGGISKTATFAQQVGFNLNYNDFQNLNTQYNNQGYRLVDFDKYYVNGTLYFAGLWNNDGIGGAWTINNHDVINFQNTIANFIANGFKPMMIDVYDGDWAVSVQDEIFKFEYSLFQNYPNPFNPSTKISWQSPVGSPQTINVFDMLGREIETIVDGYYEAGFHSTLYIPNSSLSSGVYFYQLRAGDYMSVKKMLLLK